MTDSPAPRLPALLLILSLLAWAAPAAAELSVTRGSAGHSDVSSANPVPEWIYTLRPGESFSEVANDLLAPNYPASRLLQYNKIGNVI